MGISLFRVPAEAGGRGRIDGLLADADADEHPLARDRDRRFVGG